MGCNEITLMYCSSFVFLLPLEQACWMLNSLLTSETTNHCRKCIPHLIRRRSTTYPVDLIDFNVCCTSLETPFLAHLAKGNVSFCHHLSSVNFSHFNLFLWNPLSQMNWNLVRSIYGRSFIKIAHFVPIH